MRVQRKPHLFVAGACLALAGAAQAQNSVSMYGLLDMSVGRFQAPGAAATKGVDSGNMTTSFIGVRGNEDLGGGLLAVFALESFLRTDTGAAGRFNGDPFWARSSYVGLAGPWGTVTLGRNTTSLFVQTLMFNAFGDSFGFSPAIRHTFTSGTVTGDTGWSDSVKYASPRFGGLSFTAHLAANDEGGGDNGRNGGFSALYAGGPLGLGFSYQKVRKGTVNDTTAWQLAGSYAVGKTKLFAQYGSVDNDTTGNDFRITGLGASVGVGLGAFLAQWGRIAPGTGSDRNTLSLGYDHTLSKRTDVYAVFMKDRLDGVASGTSYAVGLRHRF